MKNLIHELIVSMELPYVEVGEGITRRAAPFRPRFNDIRQWAEESASVPDWANRAAALWLLEFWMNERDACEADGLLKVDEKYTRLLRDYSMGEIIEMRNQLVRSLKQQAAEATTDAATEAISEATTET